MGTVALVGKIVGRAREVVDGHHRRPQRRWAEHRRDGKVFVVLDAHAAILARRGRPPRCLRGARRR